MLYLNPVHNLARGHLELVLLHIFMRSKAYKFAQIFLCALIILTTLFADSAQASGGENGGNAQSPVQVIVQIVVTAITLKILEYFDLP